MTTTNTETFNNTPKGEKGGVMYAIASVVGFRSSTLRVRIVRDVADCYEVVTCDLLDSGTHLMLSKSKVTVETPSTVLVHKDGFVGFPTN